MHLSKLILWVGSRANLKILTMVRLILQGTLTTTILFDNIMTFINDRNIDCLGGDLKVSSIQGGDSDKQSFFSVRIPWVNLGGAGFTLTGARIEDNMWGASSDSEV